MTSSRATLWVPLLLVLCAPVAHAQAMRRFALIAGNDHGGTGTRALRYADDDAKRIASILERLGGVKKGDVRLVLDGTAEDFLRALGELEKRALAAHGHGERTALYVYYSGHTAHDALELGQTSLPLESLKHRLAEAPADVRIGIFDSCHSGLLTRTKGVRRAPAFAIQSQPAHDAKGLVILTSSSADEDSQESDTIGGSYFSYHLESGLLGDADSSGDGKVTLSEAYAYAYERTVADTADSAAGAQHPTFSFDLEGNGGWVLTRLPRHEGVVLPAGLAAGVYYLVNGDGLIAAEVWKTKGEEKRIALAPGDYRVKRRMPDHLRLGEISIPQGGTVVLADSMLHDAPFSDDPVKGLVPERTHVHVSLVGTFQSFFEKYGRARFPSVPLFGVELQLDDFFRRNWSWGFDVAFGGTHATVPNLAVPYGFSELTLGTSIVARWPLGRLVPFVGGRVALLSLKRSFEGGGLPAQSYSTFSPGIVAGLTWHVAGGFNLTARGRVHYLFYDVDEDRSLAYWELALMVGYSL